MKFKFLSLSFILGILSLNGFSQIYVPGGVNSGVKASNNSNVGIGTASPKSPLHVEGSIYLPDDKSLWINSTSDNSNRMRVGHSSSAGYSFIDYYPALHFRTGATNSGTIALSLLSNGNVGINAVNPTAKLHVSGNSYFSGNMGIGGTSSTAKLYVNGNLYTENGKLGVGTTDPKVHFQIGNIWTFYDGPNNKIISRNTYWNGSAHVRMTTGTASQISFEGNGGIILRTIPTGNANSVVVDGAWNTVVMNNDGDVGIGTSIPAKKLHVQGDSYFSGNIGIGATSSGAKLHVQGDSYVSGNLRIGATSSTTKLHVQGDSYFSSNMGIGGTSSTAKLYVNGNLYMENGKLGVGTTDPKVQMQIGSIWTFYDGSNDKVIGRNTYYNGSSNVRIQQGVASRIYFSGVGDIVFQTVGSGSANSNISSWNTVTMKNDGSVGIGTTSTDGYKLMVNGKINCTELVVSAGLISLPGGDGVESKWPDYVFAEDYNLRNLDEVASFIQENRHLPEMPSAADVAENGINLGEINALLLKKVEELTLYILRQSEDIQVLKEEVQLLKEGR